MVEHSSYSQQFHLTYSMDSGGNTDRVCLSSAGIIMKYGEFLVSTVSIDKRDEMTQRVIAITHPKVMTYNSYHPLRV